MRTANRIKFLFLFLLALALFNSAYADTECANRDCPINVSINVVGMESYNETIQAVEYNVSKSVIIGAGNITVPANVGYIDTPMFTTNVSINIKGVVGVIGNVNFNLTLGSGVAGANFTENPDDIVLDMILDVNGTHDIDYSYIDIYIGISKTTIDNISSDAVNNMKVYVSHNDGTNSTYDLIRQSSLDLPADYLFKLQISGFSFFRIFYRKPNEGAVSPIIPNLKRSGGWFIEDWICTEWSKCSQEGIQTRNCNAKWGFRTHKDKPKEERSCVYVPEVEEKPEIGIEKPVIVEEKPLITLAIGGVFIALLVVIAIWIFVYRFVKVKGRL